MAKPKGLGRGLDALLERREADGGDLRQIAVSRLRPGRYQPRTRMDDASLDELAASIRAQGVMQPMLVRPVAEDRFEIIAGERRWRAAQRAGLEYVPAIVREVPDQSALALSLIENIQREDLNPLEEAQGIARLIDEFGLTHEAAASAVGRSRSAVSNLLRLTSLAQPVQAMLLDDRIEMGHARALAALPENAQVSLAGRIAGEHLSVREAERLAQSSMHNDASSTSRATPKKPRASADVQRLEEELAETLGAVVRIESQPNGSGRLVIRYASLDQLDGVLARLR